MNGSRSRFSVILRVGATAAIAGCLTLAWTGPAVAIIIMLLPKRLNPSVGLVIVVTMLLLSVAIATLTAYGKWKLELERARRASYRCMQCGYDLRASSGCCPECGKAFQ